MPPTLGAGAQLKMEMSGNKPIPLRDCGPRVCGVGDGVAFTGMVEVSGQTAGKGVVVVVVVVDSDVRSSSCATTTKRHCRYKHATRHEACHVSREDSITSRLSFHLKHNKRQEYQNRTENTQLVTSDVNKHWTCKDKDQAYKDQDKD